MNTESRKSILETLDYNLSTRTLSEQTGIEKRHITEYRKTHSKGRATVYSPHQKPRKMRIDPKSIDWSKRPREIADAAGVSVQRIYQVRRRLCEAVLAADDALRGREMADEA
jgi:hypothetical protein